MFLYSVNILIAFINYFSIPFLQEFLISLFGFFYIILCALVSQQKTANNLSLTFKFFDFFKGLLIFLIIFEIILLYTNPQIIINNTFFNGYLLNNFSTNIFKVILLILGYLSFSQFFNFAFKFFDFWDNFKIYPLLFLGSFFFLLLLLSTYHLLLTCLCILGMSICFYVILLGNFFSGHVAREPVTKYFLFSALSTGFFLGGIKEFYICCNTLNFGELNNSLLYYMLDNTSNLSTLFSLKYGLLLIVFAFLFKLSAAPSYFWAPEVYEGTSFAIITFIIIPTKFAVSIILLKILKFIFILPVTSNFLNLFLLFDFDSILILIIVLSIFIGGINAVIEQRIKRFIAYSSINQIGFLLIGFLGYNNSLFSIQAFLYFLITYVINLSIFLLIIGWFVYKLNFFINTFTINNYKYDLHYISDLNLLFWYLKYLTTIFPLLKNISNLFWVSFLLALFSLAGIPPLLAFYGKFYILLYAFNFEYYSVFIIGILMSIIGAYYYLRIIKNTFFEKKVFENVVSEENLTNFYYKFWICLELENVFKNGKIIFYINALTFIFCFFLVNAWFFDVYIMRLTYILAQFIILC